MKISIGLVVTPIAVPGIVAVVAFPASGMLDVLPLCLLCADTAAHTDYRLPRGPGRGRRRARRFDQPLPGRTPVHVAVEETDAVLAIVERLGGEVVTPQPEIPAVGLGAVIRNAVGDTSGPWQPEKQ